MSKDPDAQSQNPYSNLDPHMFWRSGVAECSPLNPEAIYTRKFSIEKTAAIMAAGSCFAQHVTRHMRKRGFNVLDVERAPWGLHESSHQKFGYAIYSARYGNIYTVRQLLQLAKEAAGLWQPDGFVLESNGRYFDGLRPSVEPAGLRSIAEVRAHRGFHLRCVRSLFSSMDVMIFTLGLTEAWLHSSSGTVLPVAPGVVAGRFDPSEYEFKNFRYDEIVSDFDEFRKVVKALRGDRDFRIVLTVSPVPLTATASGNHVLTATTYSKSVLRAAAGYLADTNTDIDYFPSYEIITNQAARGIFYEGNLRSIAPDGVDTVMRAFFDQHDPVAPQHVEQKRSVSPIDDADPQCDEAVLAEFAR